MILARTIPTDPTAPRCLVCGARCRVDCGHVDCPNHKPAALERAPTIIERTKYVEPQ